MTIVNVLWKKFECAHLKQDGQATIELAVMFPICLIVAVIALNALVFFEECAKFDRLFKQSVVAVAPSSLNANDISAVKGEIVEDLNKSFSLNNQNIEVDVEWVNGNFTKFTGHIDMYPTLFGMGIKEEIFGIPLAALKHQCYLVVDMYKPGVIF